MAGEYRIYNYCVPSDPLQTFACFDDWKTEISKLTKDHWIINWSHYTTPLETLRKSLGKRFSKVARSKFPTLGRNHGIYHKFVTFELLEGTDTVASDAPKNTLATNVPKESNSCSYKDSAIVDVAAAMCEVTDTFAAKTIISAAGDNLIDQKQTNNAIDGIDTVPTNTNAITITKRQVSTFSGTMTDVPKDNNATNAHKDTIVADILKDTDPCRCKNSSSICEAAAMCEDTNNFAAKTNLSPVIDNLVDEKVTSDALDVTDPTTQNTTGVINPKRLASSHILSPAEVTNNKNDSKNTDARYVLKDTNPRSRKASVNVVTAMSEVTDTFGDKMNLSPVSDNPTDETLTSDAMDVTDPTSLISLNTTEVSNPKCRASSYFVSSTKVTHDKNAFKDVATDVQNETTLSNSKASVDEVTAMSEVTDTFGAKTNLSSVSDNATGEKQAYNVMNANDPTITNTTGVNSMKSRASSFFVSFEKQNPSNRIVNVDSNQEHF